MARIRSAVIDGRGERIATCCDRGFGALLWAGRAGWSTR